MRLEGLIRKDQRNRSFPLSSLLGLSVISGGLLSCGGSGQKLADYITRVAARTGDITTVATQRSGQPPSGTGTAITTNSGGGVTIPGGSMLFQISSRSTYGAVALSVDGVSGYFELTGLTLGVGNRVTIVVTVGQSAPQTFNLQVAAGNGSSYGTAQAIPVHLTPVGTGDVQINVSWDVDSDLDLHVIEPGNTEIYYANRGPTASGGQLDLDSNTGCILDYKRAENVTWPNRPAPHGNYIVKVDLWSACGQAKTYYVVTVNIRGHPPQVFDGTFLLAQADGGGAGAGTMVTTFTY